MRTPAFLAGALALALAGAAAHAEDRYGPPRGGSYTGPDKAVPAYSGPMLGWSNKVAPATLNGAPSLVSQPQPMALARQFLRPAQTPQAVPPPPPPPPVEELAPDYLEGGPSAPLPTSLYGGPPQAAQAPIAPVAAVAPQAPAPQRLAAAAPQAPATGSPSHYYSVHRPYGLTPDAPPAPAAGPNLVLIGPPDETIGSKDAEQAQEDDGEEARTRKKPAPERQF